MPEECYLNVHEKSGADCRNEVIDHCRSVEVESAVSGGECQECASAYERDGGCTYALKGNWFQMDMPDECYLKLNEKSRVNCRNKVIDHCISVGGDVMDSPKPSRNSFVATKMMPSEGCQACATAYERDGGCQYALKGKWFKMKMPEECYLNVHEKSGADCRNEVIDHCRSVEVESAVSGGECQECASAYERDGGCTYALKGNWFQMDMPDECYLKLNEKSRVNCRNKVIDHCISVGGDVIDSPKPSRNSFVATKTMPSEGCQACAAAYERDGGCKYALKGKWFKMRMPE